MSCRFEISADGLDVQVVGSALEKDGAASLDERACGCNDHEGNKQADGWVRVFCSLFRYVFDDGGGDDDANVVESIACHVDNDSQHAQVTVVGSWFGFVEVGMVTMMVDILSKQLG